MSASAIEALLNTTQSGEKDDPSQRGANFREPIFYGGESAYSFQFRDCSVPKYQADDEWLERQRGFSIQVAHDVVHAIIRLQNHNFTNTIANLAQRDPDERTFMPYFVFTTDEVAKFSGIDPSLINKVVHSFVLSAEEKNTSFRAVDDFNVASAMLIISIGDGGLLLLERYTLEQSLYESPFYWMCADRVYRDTALRNRGNFVEAFSMARLTSGITQKRPMVIT